VKSQSESSCDRSTTTVIKCSMLPLQKPELSTYKINREVSEVLRNECEKKSAHLACRFTLPLNIHRKEVTDAINPN